jgi:uncharacterized protein YbjQ (UPF0145 family)
MKTSIISYSILILIAVSACSPSLIIWEEAQYLVSGYDFTEYSQSGFLFTPEPYLGDYESMGLIEIVYVPSVKQHAAVWSQQTASLANQPGSHRITVFNKPYQVSEANSEDIIRILYEVATDLGANAVTHFEIKNHTLDNNGTPIPSVRVSGFAIKRL